MHCTVTAVTTFMSISSTTALSWMMEYLKVKVNPLRAKLFKGNKNMYLHFMSFLHIDLTQVLKILPQVRPGPTYSI